MNALFALTVANIRSYTRDRAALFWTLAFPLIFIFMFGFIFQGGGGDASLQAAWVDDDGTPASAELRAAFAAQPGTELADLDLETARTQMRDGDVATILVVPAGYGEAVAAAAVGNAPPTSITVYTDPSRENATVSVFQSVGAVLGVVNLGGRPPLVIAEAETIQTENLNFISYFVPSMQI